MYMHIVISIVTVYGSLPGPQEKDDSARRISGLRFHLVGGGGAGVNLPPPKML